MNPKLLFWIPAGLRLSFIVLMIVILSATFDATTGLTVGVITFGIVLTIQLQYLYRLSDWLDNPRVKGLPNGWGAWTSIFSKLYRLRRDDEKNRVELSEWLTRFRQAMSLLPDGVVIMDDVLFLEWCNPAAEQHLGLGLTNDKGRRVTNLIRDPAFIDYIILGNYDKPLSLSFRERKLLLHIIPFENRRQILVTHDTTETDRVEMIRRDFIANASHELRTPLTVINGFLEIASTQPNLEPATRCAHLKMMTEQGKRMQNLVEDMLALTRLESVDYPVRPERVNMRSLLDQLLQEAEALSGGQHTISLKQEGPDIIGSTEELRSAFANLISNAVRYTSKGGTIAIGWSNGGSGAKFSVRDNGIGISPEHIHRLTERFYRVDKGLSRETRGTGLGLAIVKHVLLRHCATLAIESRPESGSEFVISFPQAMVIDGHADT